MRGEIIRVISVLPNYCEGYDNINRARSTVLSIIVIFIPLKNVVTLTLHFPLGYKNIHTLS